MFSVWSRLEWFIGWISEGSKNFVFFWPLGYTARINFKVYLYDKHPNQERSLVLLKTDAVQRSPVGEIIAGLSKLVWRPVPWNGWSHRSSITTTSNKSDEWKKGKGIVEELKSRGVGQKKEDWVRILLQKWSTAMVSPVAAIVFEGNKAVSVVTKIVGTTEPATPMGTIRGDYNCRFLRDMLLTKIEPFATRFISQSSRRSWTRNRNLV